MRLCWNDYFHQKPIRGMSRDEADIIYNMGFRVAGINALSVEATDDDIARARDILGEAGLMPGPFSPSTAVFHPDPAINREERRKTIRGLEVAGKLGCPNIRVAGGSMDPVNVWGYHPENHTQQALDAYVDSVRELVHAAEDNGCMITPETTQWTIVGSVPRMKEFVDRCDSPYVKIIFDPVNHMTPERLVDSGRWMKCVTATLGDRIGVIHVKDARPTPDKLLVTHIDEADMGTGIIDHEALIEASDTLEPWKTFSLEHINRDPAPAGNIAKVKTALDHILRVADRMGYTFTDPALTREKWERTLGNN